MKIKPKDFKIFVKKQPTYLIKKQLKKLKYVELNKEDEKKYILEIIKTILEKKIKKSGKNYKNKWEKGWEENYRNFKKSKNTRDLIPKYFFKSRIARLGNRLILTKSKSFDLKIIKLITDYVYEKYLLKEKNIIEFGCGTGHNLISLSKLNKKANLFGLDWSKSSQKILKLLKKKFPKIHGYSFNFFNPKFSKKIKLNKKDWSCFTVASLEQVGNKFKKFVKFLKQNNPNLIINIEPINELLSKEKILDYLSIKYSKNRNYLDNYYNYLKNLDKKKIIKIIEVKKSYFGSLFINGYSIVAWKFLK